ncbi:hypothetical protein Tco_0527861 [Tanacetum coccineum]
MDKTSPSPLLPPPSHVSLPSWQSHTFQDAIQRLLAIRGTLVDGEWIVDMLAVKSVFLKYISTQFSSPVSPRICFVDQFTNRLSLEQQVDLERNVSNEEKKSAVWDCGMNKPLVLMASLLSSFVDIGSF